MQKTEAKKGTLSAYLTNLRSKYGKISVLFVVFAVLVSVTGVSGIYSFTRGRADAATLSTLNFQGRLLDASGTVVPDGTYNIEFNLYTVASGGSTQWTETYLNTGTPVTMKYGYFSVQLGSLTSFPSTINWDQEQWLGMTVRGTGSCAFGSCTPADSEMTPRFKLTGVPYAFQAGSAQAVATNNTSTASTNSNGVTIQSGNATGATSNSGNISIDAGTATGTAGTISLGAANASALLLGRSGLATAIQGSLTVAEATTLNGDVTLGNALTDLVTISGTIQGTNALVFEGATADGFETTIAVVDPTADVTLQIPALAAGTYDFCTTSGNCLGGGDIIQGGNTYGTAIIIGSNDGFDLELETSNTTRVTVNATTGNVTLTSDLAVNGGDITSTGDLTVTPAGGDVNIVGNLSVSAGSFLSLAGGNTASRPASPTEGMVYYDTTTKQLLTYANGKWQADRSTATKIVAASNSSQAIKDAADYVADGTADEVEINAALTAASGGKVYLAEGTYTIAASISIPNNTTIAGAGDGTLVTIPNSFNASINAITNTDTSTGTGVVIQDLRLDGNRANQSGSPLSGHGVYLNNMGSATRRGGKVTHVTSNSWFASGGGVGFGIYLSVSSNNIIEGNIADNNSSGGIGLASSTINTVVGNTTTGSPTYGIMLNGSTYNTVTGNTSKGNSNSGIHLTTNSSVNTVSGNTSYSNVTGITTTSSSNNNIISGNNFYQNTTYGISINSNSNVISSNTTTDNGGATTNNGILLATADNNQISNNTITDSACTTTCYAINISDAASDKNYLSGNRFAGSAANAASINDAGTGTIYDGQQTNSTTSTNSDVSDFRFRGSANSATAFAVQNAAGTSVLNVDTSTAGVGVTGTLTVSGTSTFNGLAQANAKLYVNTATTADALAQTLISTGATTNKGLVIQGVASQTANLLEFQTSTGSLLGSFDVNGYFRGAGLGSTVAGKSLLMTNSTSGSIEINTQVSTNIGLLIKGVASQTNDLLALQNSAGTLLAKVDANGFIQGQSLVVYGNSTSGYTTKYQNAGTGGVTTNDVVILANDGGASKVMTTTTARDTRVYGVAKTTVSAGTDSSVAIAGNTLVNADTGAVAIGDQLVTSTTAGQVTVDNNATTGILGIATTAKAGGSSGTVGVSIRPVNGQTNPNFQAGNLTTTGTITSGLINGQTISSSANFTGTLAVTGNTTLTGDLAVDGGDITSTGDLTVTPAGGDTFIVGTLDVSARAAIGLNGVINSDLLAADTYDSQLSVQANITTITDQTIYNGSNNQLQITPNADPATFASVNGANNQVIINPANTTNTSKININGSNNLAWLQGSGNFATVNGALIQGINDGTGTLTNLTGATIYAINAGTGGTSNVIGSDVGVTNYENATNVIGNRVDVSNQSNTITNAFGVQVGGNNLGTVTSGAGIAVEDFFGTNSTNLLLGTTTIPSGTFSIYNSSTRDNVFAGNLRIGSTTAPTVALDVTGDVKVSGTLAVSTLGTSDTSTYLCRNSVNQIAGCTSAPLSSSLTDNVTNAFDLQEGTNNYININTTNASENISFGNATTNPSYNFLGSGTLAVAGATTISGTLTVGPTAGSTATLTVNGATKNSTLALGDFATGGSIGSAATTVDIYTSFSIAQTTSSQTITVPSPTDSTGYGRTLYISNIGTTSLTVLGQVLAPGTSITAVWSNTNSGASWQTSGTAKSGGAASTVSTNASGGASSAVASKNPGVADYINNSTTSAQTVINTALSAVGTAGGGTVVLMEGTYIIDGSISVPNNVTLAGSGLGTVIKVKNGVNATFNAITNSDTTTGTKVGVQNLTIDGNKANQTLGFGAGMRGVYFNSVGASNREGGRIMNVAITNMGGTLSSTGAISIVNSYSNSIIGNSVSNNDRYGIYGDTNSRYNLYYSNVATSNNNGFFLTSQNDSVNSNISSSNTNAGFYMNGLFQSLNGNTSRGDATGFYIATSVTATGNVAQSNTLYGFNVGGANNNIVGNYVYDSGGATTNNAIYVTGTLNSIDSNYTIDSSCTTDCYGINIASGAKNSLSNNRLFGSVANSSGINDAGTNTIYSGQQVSATTTAGEVSDFRFRGSTDSATAFAIQNAAGTSVLNVDTTTAGITVTGTTTSSGLITGQAGLTVTGAVTNINASSNFATNINTGTSTGAVNIGNSTAGAIAIQSATTIGLTGATTVTGLSGGSSTALNIVTGATTNIGLVVKAAASQTADLLQVQNSAGYKLLGVSAAGNIDTLGYYSSPFGGIGSIGNLITNSEDLSTGIGWSVTNAVVFADLYTAPDGNTTAEACSDTLSGGFCEFTTGTASGSTYTFSLWARKATAGTTNVDIRIDGATTGTGTVATYTLDNTTWQRISVTQNTSGFTGNVKVRVYPGGTGGSSSIGYWGAQLVAGSNPGVYTRTGSTTVAAGGGVAVNGNLTVGTGGNVAFQKNGTDISSTGTQNDLAIGNGALFRFTNATPLTITGIAGGTDGRRIILVNAGSSSVILNNSDAGSVAANRMVTGTGGAVTLVAGSSIEIVYDSGASVWRVTSAGAVAGGYIQNQSTVSQSASFRISGSGQADTSFLAPSFQNSVVGTLSVGTTANTTALTLGSTSLTGTLTIDSGASSTISIGAGASARTVNLGTGAAAQTVNVGSTNTTSSLTLQSGTGNLNITTQGTGSLNIGNNAVAQTLNIGNTTGATAVNILAGSGNINLNAGTIATNQTTVNLLNTTATTVNAFGAATALNLGATTGTLTLNNPTIATAATTLTLFNTTATTINFGGAATTLSIGATTGTLTVKNANQTFGNAAGSGVFTNNGATLNSTLAIANLAAGGSIGTAATTVDIYTSISVAQTTASQTITIPTPTANTGYGRLLYASNIGTTSFTLLGVVLNPGSTATLVWSNTNGGASWQYAGADAGGIQNQNAADQTANFRISGTGRANTSFTTPLVDSISGALSVGTSNATSVTIGNATNNSGITIDSGTGAINIGTGAQARTTNIGTGAAAQTVTLGSTDTTSATTINAGSGNLSLNAGTILGSATTQNLFNTVATTLNFGGAATSITIGATSGTLTVRNANQTFGNAAGSGVFTNNGATVNTTLALGNFATGGAIGTAAATVDVYTSVSVAQTTASQTITIPTPTASTAYGRMLYLSNVGTTSFVLGGVTMNAGATATLIWSNTNGAASWQFAGADGNGILNQNASSQTANFRITGSGRADTSFLTPAIDVASAGTLSLGVTTATAISIGKLTVTTTNVGNFTIGASAGSGTTFTNNGATINSVLALGNFAAGGAIGTAATTVDIYTAVSVAQTTASQTLTIPTPTTNPTTVFGRILYLSNVGSASFTYGGVSINPGTTATLIWSNTDGAGTGAETWQFAGADGSGIQNQNAADQTANFRISGTGRANTSFTTPLVDSITGALSIGTSTATSVTVGNTGTTTGITLATSGAISFNASSAQFTEVTGTRTLTVQTRTAAATAGSSLTVQAGSASATGAATAGGTLTLQGGSANGASSAANGGNVVISGGTGFGTGVKGLVVIDTATYSAATVQNFTASANITQANIDTYGSILISGNAAGWVATLTDPTNTTTGRVLYITNSGSFDITLAANTVGVAVAISLKPASTATMYWNGTDWTAAGASSSTDLQAAYNNTATSAGGAELVLNASGGAADGLTVRNNATSPIIGGIFEAQTSVGSNIFSVNNNAAEFSVNGGAETSTNFSTNWLSAPAGGTITRNTTSANNATGVASVSVVTTATAAHGAENKLASTLTNNLKYTVSYTVKADAASAGFTTLETMFSADGSATAGLVRSCVAGTPTYSTGTASQSTTTITGVGTTWTAAMVGQIFVFANGASAVITGFTNATTLTTSASYSQTVASQNYNMYNAGNTVNAGSWSRVSCSFTAPSSGITANNAVFIRQTDATARTFYIDNLSVTISADVNHAVDGSADDATNFATNWTAAPAGGTVTRTTSTLYDTSGSAQVVTTATAGHGMRNNMAITPSVSTQYLVTFYAKSSNAFSDIRVRYTRDGGTNFVSCGDYNTQSVSTTGFTRITCLLTTDGTTATNPDLLIEQTAGTARTFYVDALTVTLNTNNSNNVQIGAGAKGGPVTLFTLDRAATAPIAANNDAYLGSMYYDTTTGRIQCYEADGWGACGSAPDNYVNLNPEYSGAVLNGSGVGTMTADFCANQTGVLQVNTSLCATGESRNFYKWTSPQASDQTYSIYVSYQLPATFKGFSSDDTVQLTARTDNTTNGSVSYEMFKSESGALTACGTATTVTTTVSTWQTVGVNGNEATSCSFTTSSANAFVIFKINVTAKSNANVYVGTLSFTTTGR